MAVNKNALIRYKALDYCFSNKYKRYYIDDLIQYCSDVLTDHYGKETNISRRQILLDIDFMKSEAGYDAPIISVKDGRKAYYKYEVDDFSILKKPLTNNEIMAIDNTLELISRMKGIPGAEGLEIIETKLINAKDPISKSHIISFEENEFLRGIEHLTPLYNYIKNKQSIVIKYQSFKSDLVQNFSISPYYLKQYNKRWFLFGWNNDFYNLQNLALDRIIEINPQDLKFIETTIDFEEYFEDIIGVTNFEENEIENVIIQLSSNIVPYIQSKPIHGSQKIKDNILFLQVKLNYELESLLLSYGENIAVIEPLVLKEKLTERLQNTIKHYS